MDKLNGCIFWLIMMIYLKTIKLFGIKSALILKKNWISSLSTKKHFWKSRGDEVSYFYDKEISKVDFNHTCLAVIRLDSALKKDENYFPQVFLRV